MAQAKRRRMRRAAFCLISVTVSLAIAEASLQVLVPLLRKPATEPTVADNVLGHRPNPALPGHDEAGWRNPRRLATSPIVCLGDSQTYGANVSPSEAWPRRLEARLGIQVYSMAYGGYGPVQLLSLLPEALALRPRLLIVGFYAGNDLLDAFHMVHVRGQSSTLGSAAVCDRQTFSAAAASFGDIEQLWRERYHAISGRSPEESVQASRRQEQFSFQLAYVLERVRRRVARSLLLRTASGKDAEWIRTTERVNQLDPNLAVAIDAQGLRTVLTPGMRDIVMNLEDPRIREGLRLSLIALMRIHTLARDVGTKVLVVLIPTKELVFKASVLGARIRPSEGLAACWEHEEALWGEVRSSLSAQGVPWVEVRSNLENADQVPYATSHDGHPMASGHEAIAAAIQAHDVVVELKVDLAATTGASSE